MRIKVALLLLVAAGFIATPMYSLAESQGLKANEVCMMNNKFFGKEQIPVEVEGKTYYGCCQGCKTTLKENPATRKSIDPYTGKEVDKADAFIVKKPNGSDEVLYFESKETYESFLKEHSNHGNSMNLSQSEGQIYTCPMHPEVTNDKPGSCPKCGMTLKPVKESYFHTRGNEM